MEALDPELCPMCTLSATKTKQTKTKPDRFNQIILGRVSIQEI